jgi:proline dehydrogenase
VVTFTAANRKMPIQWAVGICQEVLCAIHENHLNSNLSIKLTQFGLKLDEAFCYSNLKRLLETASRYNNFVRVDMENSSTTSSTTLI